MTHKIRVMPTRYPIQLVTGGQYDSNDILYALCNDGTIWKSYFGNSWIRLTDIPQPEDTE